MKTYLFVKEISDFDKLGNPIFFREFMTIIASSENEAWEKFEEQLRPRSPKRKNYEQEFKRWKITKEFFLCRWKYKYPPILKQKDFIKELRNTISESRVFYVPWGVTAEIVISNWIDYFYHNKPISPEIEKIFINSKPIENLWQLF